MEIKYGRGIEPKIRESKAPLVLVSSGVSRYAVSYVPDAIKTIFGGFENLTEISIPNGITSIESDVLWKNAKLKSIEIPESVTKIGFDAFPVGLSQIRIDPNNPVFCSVDDVVYSKDMKRLLICPEKKDGMLVIPDGVTSIGFNAFGGGLFSKERSGTIIVCSPNEQLRERIVSSYRRPPKNLKFEEPMQQAIIEKPQQIDIKDVKETVADIDNTKADEAKSILQSDTKSMEPKENTNEADNPTNNAASNNDSNNDPNR